MHALAVEMKGCDSLGTPENSAIQKLSVIIIIIVDATVKQQSGVHGRSQVAVLAPDSQQDLPPVTQCPLV